MSLYAKSVAGSLEISGQFTITQCFYCYA